MRPKNLCRHEAKHSQGNGCPNSNDEASLEQGDSWARSCQKMNCFSNWAVCKVDAASQSLTPEPYLDSGLPFLSDALARLTRPIANKQVNGLRFPQPIFGITCSPQAYHSLSGGGQAR